MYPNEKNGLEKIYGTPYLDQKAPGYYPILAKKKKPIFKSNFILDSATFYLAQRLSIDTVIKELSFALVALITYLFMQSSGRIKSLGEFGYIIGALLIGALFFNLFKASIKSLTPGLLCLVGGLVLLSDTIHFQCLKFISKEAINYVIGAGAFFVAMSLFKSEND